MWKCKKCGACCKFISIVVRDNLGSDSKPQLEARGFFFTRQDEALKMIIPSRCRYLTEDNKCSIWPNCYKICKLSGKKECEQARKDYEKIKKKR